MVDVHIIQGSNSEWTAVIHIAVPDTNNAAGQSFRTALINSGLGGKSILSVGSVPESPGPGEIAQSELDLLETGELLESVSLILLESGGTSNNDLAATLDAFYAIQKTVAIDNMSAALRYYGFTRDVPP